MNDKFDDNGNHFELACSKLIQDWGPFMECISIMQKAGIRVTPFEIYEPSMACEPGFFFEVTAYLTTQGAEIFIHPAMYDALKRAIFKIWGIVSNKSLKQNYAQGIFVFEVNKINPSQSVSYRLEGSMKEETIDKIIDAMLSHASNDGLIEKQLSNIQTEKREKLKIRMKFNREKGEWEPSNIHSI